MVKIVDEANLRTMIGRPISFQSLIRKRVYRKNLLLCNSVTSHIDFVNIIQIKRKKEIGPTVN